MQTTELRERLASAFHAQVTSQTIRHNKRVSLVPSDGIDWTSAYELADIALVAMGVEMSRAEKVVRETELASGGVFSPSDRAAVTGVVQEIIVEHDVRTYDRATDNCPECDARPEETCGVELALLHGYPGPLNDCPRDA